MKTIESDDVPNAMPANETRRVVLSLDRGWDVVIEHDREIVSITHCTEWHRVERCAVPVVATVAAQCRRKA